MYDSDAAAVRSAQGPRLGPVFRQAFAVKKLISNHYQNAKECRRCCPSITLTPRLGGRAAGLSLHADHRPKRTQGAPQRHEQLARVSDALYAVKTGMTDQLTEFMDSNGFIDDAKITAREKGCSQGAQRVCGLSEDEAEAIAADFANTNRAIRRLKSFLRSCQERKGRWDAWTPPLFQGPQSRRGSLLGGRRCRLSAARPSAPVPCRRYAVGQTVQLTRTCTRRLWPEDSLGLGGRPGRQAAKGRFKMMKSVPL